MDFQEYPKAVYHPTRERVMIIASDATHEEQILANWGVKTEAPEPEKPEADVTADELRVDLEMRAERLGIHVDKRWSDKTLADKIEAASE